MRILRINTLVSSITLALCLLVTMPIEAQSHRNGPTKTEQSRKNNTGNHKPNKNNSSGRRPNINTGKKDDKVNNNKRPDNKKQPGFNHPHQSPGNKPLPGNQGKPGNNKPNRPGNEKPNIGHTPHKPGAPVQHPKPGFKPHSNSHVAPPARPHRPHYHSMPRVKPLPHWRPRPNIPRINSILGLTFGTLYNITLDHLYTHHYNVYGYNDNSVYLKNVSQLNYRWNDVVLNYSAGRLDSAQFIYSTSHNSKNRFNNVYKILCNTYGEPISNRIHSNNTRECVWYGGDNQGMVSLEYYYHQGRYYTTLSYGNAY